MKAPSSSENLRLLLPDPQHSRRITRVLITIIAVAFASALILLAVMGYIPWLTGHLPLWRGATVITLVLLLLLLGLRYRFRSGVTLRRIAHRVLSQIGLGGLLALPILHLFAVLALDTEHSPQEILVANWPSLALVVLLTGCLSFQVRLSHWIDRRFFWEIRQREQLFLELLDAIKTSSDLPEVARRTIRTIHQLWHPTHIRLLFADASLTDYHFAVDTLTPPAHLPENFPLQALFEPDLSPHCAPFLPNLHLSDAEQAWIETLQSQILVPLAGSNHRVVGLLVIGTKKSGQPYQRDELQLLLAIARQIAFVSERAPLKVTTEQEAQQRLQKLARLEAAQRTAPNLSIIEETDAQDQFLVQEHLNHLPQRQEFPARVG
ncbi:MAG: hypothetical protein JST84_13550 [Acidobacteria bacterium]|nr:hypothetical protein [Acidobacteriota bacterium]